VGALGVAAAAIDSGMAMKHSEEIAISYVRWTTG
jgi:hypothetical protein